jgi:hypothetical protein
MNQQNMKDLNQLINRYMGIWNEPSADQRRKITAELWADDGVQFVSQQEFRGHQALEERVFRAYERFVQTEGCIFRLSGDIDAHHNGVRFTWEMVSATGDEVKGAGLIFLLLNDAGRILLDYQFQR